MTRPVPPEESGVVLINVLMYVAIASALVLLMITREEQSVDRALRVREAAEAMAAVKGGAVSALVALRRDQREAPQTDNVTEPWAALAESGAPIRGGRFDLAIADAQGRFNVNNLRAQNAAAAALFDRIGRAAGLEPTQIGIAIALIRRMGPVTDLRPLRLAGLDEAVLGRLETMITALPGETGININAITPELLAILVGDSVVADRLIDLRRRQGYLTPLDLAREGVALPPDTSFTSGTFWVRTRATIGTTTQQEAALIVRRQGPDLLPETVIVARWRNAAVPEQAPAFPRPR